jgi:arylsulfatase A-like enzyme
LAENNLLDNTLVVITSDHGPRLNAMDLRYYNVLLISGVRGSKRGMLPFNFPSENKVFSLIKMVVWANLTESDGGE